MDKQTVKDIQRTIMMKLNKIDYKEVDLISGYEEEEQMYRQLRDKLGEVTDSITWLMTYEHGGSKMKSLYSKMTMITTTSKLNCFSNKDIYEANGLVGMDLSKVETSSGLSDISKKYSRAYLEASKNKVEMNNKLKLQIEWLTSLKEQANAIDKKRKKIANIRYDLEMEKKSKAAKTAESLAKESEMEREFKELSKSVLGDMERFLGSDGVSGVLQKVAEAHLEFFERTAKALKEVK